MHPSYTSLTTSPESDFTNVTKKNKKNESLVFVYERMCEASNKLMDRTQAKRVHPTRKIKVNKIHHMDEINVLTLIEQILHLIKAKRPRDYV